jgi:hypothetical protein
MICLVYRETGRRAGAGTLLEPVQEVTVPDTAADPETAAWTSFTRAGKQDPSATYQVFRQGKGFSTARQTNVVSTALGPVRIT